MKILQPYVQSLTCVEVLDILKEPMLPDNFSRGKTKEKLYTQVYQVKKYLQEPTMPSSVIKSRDVAKLKLKGLTKLEWISIVDSRPISLVELVPIIEESDRFTDEDLKEIIGHLDLVLPFSRPVDDE
jgi:two-component SAPR family response regulator